jgi:hypothetical protein
MRSIGARSAPALAFLCLWTFSRAQELQRSGAFQDTDPARAEFGAHIALINGYPELRVDGQPFFIHVAAFPYYGIPRDLWASSLNRYRDLGINTIDLSIPWNWHEPREGEFDFDGHTAPGRDLRELLSLIAAKGFRLIVRPGPLTGGEWRSAGYPDWLLADPAYKMTVAARIVGADPPAELAETADADRAANLWLGNEEHLHQVALWLAAVAHELAPYDSMKPLRTPPATGEANATPENTPSVYAAGAAGRDGSSEQPESPRSGPLLYVVLGGPAALGTSTSGAYWRYMETLRHTLLDAGLEANCIVLAARPGDAAPPATAGTAWAIAGRWPPVENSGGAADSPPATGQGATPDIETIASLAESLRMQPDFPAMVLDFTLGSGSRAMGPYGFSGGKQGLLLVSRSLLAEGISGFEYSAFQEMVVPPGYETLKASADFARKTALDIVGDSLPLADGVRRNASLVQRSGAFLASSHPRTVAGLVNMRGALAQSEDLSAQRMEPARKEFDGAQRQVQRVMRLADVSADLTDPATQPAEALLHDPVLFLVIPEQLRSTPLSEREQAALLDYAHRGGTLICDPQLPAGALFEKALPASEMLDTGTDVKSHELGNGRVVIWRTDFYSWVHTDESLAASRERPEAAAAIQALRSMLQGQGVSSPVLRSEKPDDSLLFNELVPNAATGPFGAVRADCHPAESCAEGLLSISNWGDDQAQDTIRILETTTNMRAATPDDYVELPIHMPPRESLMLPLNASLCTVPERNKPCTDRVAAAGAELVSFTRGDKTLEITFFAPARASILLYLETAPRKVELLESARDEKFVWKPPEFPREPPQEPVPDLERNLEGTYGNETHIFSFELPRGAAPTYLRTVKIHLPYTPHVPAAPKPAKDRARGFAYSLIGSLRLPATEGDWLPAAPPVIALDAGRGGRLALNVQNLGEGALTLHVEVTGAVVASKTIRFTGKEKAVIPLDLRAGDSTKPDGEGLLHGELQLSSNEQSSKTPLGFVIASGDAPAGYRCDLARSGTPDWIIENDRLRMILAPAAGGRLLALMDKPTAINLTDPIGGLRDLIRFAGDSELQNLTFNLPYDAQWERKDGGEAIRMTGRFPDGAPVAGEIEKTVRVSGSNTVQVEYHARSLAAGHAEQDGSAGPAALLVTSFSVPAFEGGALGTQFCWKPPNSATAAIPAELQCEAFGAAAGAIAVPEGVSQLEIRTPAQPALTMIWKEGRVSITPQRDSAQVLLEFPAASPDGNVGPYSVSYIVGELGNNAGTGNHAALAEKR